MCLLKTSLLRDAAAGEGSAFDAANEFDADEFVQVLKVHRDGNFVGEGLPWRTISFDKAKIRRTLCFMQ